MLDAETINKLKQVRVIDKATGALKRIDIDNTVEPELQAIDLYVKGWDQKINEHKLMFKNFKDTIKGRKIA